MSETDLELIAPLRDNARLSVVDLARKLKVARSTVQNRIARLERDGVILGYTVKLSPDTLMTFDTVLNEIRSIEGIANTETSILLAIHRL